MEYPTYIAITQLKTHKTYPLDSTEEFKIKLKETAAKYKLINGILFTRVVDEEKEECLEVLHEGNIEEVIKMVHSEGHFGINNTWYRVKSRYFSPTRLFERIKEIVKNCDVCQYRKKKPARRTVYGKPILTPSTPFYMVGCDAVGPVIESKRGNRMILVAVDYLTRWPIAKAVKRIDEETTLDFLVTEILQDHGVPNFLLTDRGSNFVARYVKAFLKQVNCRHLTTSAFRPQTNGLVERTNQSLVQAIAKITKDKQENVEDWDLSIPGALLALRSMKSESTGYTPGFLLYGHELRTPSLWVAPREDYVEGEYQEEVNKRVEYVVSQLKESRKKAREESNEKKKKQKERYDVSVQHKKRYEIGEQVLMKDQYPDNKFADRWIGPMTVKKVNNSGTYHLVGPNARRLEGSINSDQLIPYHCKNAMIPDVQKKLNEQLFKSWIERKGARSDRENLTSGRGA
ncbi:hypothetical protein INT47_005045 [Mucor saturninus]|uniref:Integrase catalytic domain-containing protein n=1 Tax=Mucor saturninus TaxID=64648 RepID=A0A8H7QP84_9FUNG|nr:hypothetical protein INT47_005045 [Mucor saturninus]